MRVSLLEDTTPQPESLLFGGMRTTSQRAPPKTRPGKTVQVKTASLAHACTQNAPPGTFPQPLPAKSGAIAPSAGGAGCTRLNIGPATVGKASKGHTFMPFKEALICARALKLKTGKEWEARCRSVARPANIPARPDKFYKHDGWQSWGHWLGTFKVAPKDQQFLPFKTALLCARSWKLTGTVEWEAWAKSSARPANIPSHPERAYKHEGWQGYGHWLGTGKVCVPKDQVFLSFEKALLYARSVNLRTKLQWELWRKSGARPANVPAGPDKYYKNDGWQGWRHWLGTDY